MNLLSLPQLGFFGSCMASKARLATVGYIRQNLWLQSNNEDISSLITDLIFVFYFGKQDIKLLFLDVDGVLNTQWDTELREDLIQNLGQIIHKTNCKIILSSTCRLHQLHKIQLFHELKQKGDVNIDGIYIGDTPHIANGLIRALEIESSLSDMNTIYNIIAWCAIDDDNLEDPLLFTTDSWYIKRKCKQLMKNHFVKTSAAMGLTKNKMTEVIRILTDSQLCTLYEEK